MNATSRPHHLQIPSQPPLCVTVDRSRSTRSTEHNCSCSSCYGNIRPTGHKSNQLLRDTRAGGSRHPDTPDPTPHPLGRMRPRFIRAACWKLWKALGRLGLALPLPAELPTAGSRVAEMSPAPGARTTTTTTTRPRTADQTESTRTRHPQPTTRSTARLTEPPSRNSRLGKGPDNPGIWSGVASRRSHVASTTTSGSGRRRSPENPWEWGLRTRSPVPAAQVVKDRLLRPLLSHVHPSSVTR